MHALLSLSLLLISQPDKQTDLPPGAIARLGSAHFQHPSHASHAALSPDGKLLATAASSDGMRLWDVATGKQLLYHARTKKGNFGSVAFSPDGKTLVSRREQAIVFWDVDKRETRLELADLKYGYFVPAFSGDSKRVAYFSTAGNIRVLDVATGKAHAEWGPQTGAMTFTADGKTLISIKNGLILQFRDVDSGKTIREIKLGDSHYSIDTVVLSPRNDRLAIADGTGRRDERTPPMQFRMLDVASGKERYRLDMKWDEGFVSALAFAPDGKTLVMARRPMSPTTFSNRLEMRDVASGELLRTVPLPGWNYHSLSFSADGKMLAVAGEEFVARLFTYPDFKPHLPPAGHTREVATVVFAPTGNRAYSVGGNGILITWDLKSGQAIATRPLPGGWSRDLFASPDGQFLVAASWTSTDNSETRTQDRFMKARKGVAHVWQPDGDNVRKFGPVSGSVALSPDGTTLAAGDGPRLCLWDVASGKIRLTIDGRAKDLRSVAFAPDGQRVAAISSDGILFLWHVSTGAPAGRLPLSSGDGRPFYGMDPPQLAFTPDGRHVVSFLCGSDTLIEVSEVATGQRAQFTRFAKKRILDPVLLCHGRTLFTGAGVNPLLFDLATGQVLPKRDDVPGIVNAVALSPDRRTFLAAANDGYVYRWNADVLNAPHTNLKLSDKELELNWSGLNGSASAAYAAHWELAAGGDAVVKFLGERLKPIPGPGTDQVARRIEELGNENFKVRDKAFLDLEKWGLAVEIDVRAALTKKPPLETRRRLEELAAKLDKAPMPEDWLRTRRAIATLEAIGGDGARAVLTKLAGGASGAVITVEAKASLNRMR